ncbi:thiamine transporter 2-like [Branchiostoma lanceolatum]|uniref:thiamine transporter 2-like n=1 Tax=Branchiostoma lanceolatum TaxID=7740 RepID=UPI003455C146
MEMSTETRAIVLLCLYGFFKEMRPSEPFLTPYLKGPDKNLTEEQVDNQIYPVWTYSYLACLFLVFLLTDFLRYKPVIILEGLAYIGTWVILLWGQGVLTMQFMQFVYGVATATEIAYYSYIYVIVSDERYQKVTSYTRSVVLVGRCAAGVVGQAVVSGSKESAYIPLNYVSLASVTVALCISIFLPSAKKSMFFHRYSRQEEDPDSPPSPTSTEGNDPREEVISDNSGVQAPDSAGQITDGCVQAPDSVGQITDGCVQAADNRTHQPTPSQPQALDSSLVTSEVNTTGSGKDNIVVSTLLNLWTDFRLCYGSRHLLLWSLWWSLATCGSFQVGNYVQNLWDAISPAARDGQVWNGAIEAAATLLGAMVSFSMGYLHVNWIVLGEMTLGVLSALDAALLIVMATAYQIWVNYICYVIFRMSYQFLITIATFQIAQKLTTERYALVFGCNTFVALLLQTILTAVLVDKTGLDAPVRTQFIVYGVYFGVIAAIFLTGAVVTLTRLGWREVRRRWRLVDNDT